MLRTLRDHTCIAGSLADAGGRATVLRLLHADQCLGLGRSTAGGTARNAPDAGWRCYRRRLWSAGTAAAAVPISTRRGESTQEGDDDVLVVGAGADGTRPLALLILSGHAHA